jgi:hypothetical protein
VKSALVVLAAAASLTLTACGGTAQPAAHASAATPSCPAVWHQGWLRLARQIHAPVYCPGWMPNPLDGQIGGEWNGLRSVDRHGGFLVSFIDQENGTEVHVNFHRWPGLRMPKCESDTSSQMIPCYSDPGGRLNLPGIHATLYTVSRAADQWHLSYLWRANGATYVVSEHVAPPYSFDQVKRNVTRLLRSLVLVRPSA